MFGNRLKCLAIELRRRAAALAQLGQKRTDLDRGLLSCFRHRFFECGCRHGFVSCYFKSPTALPKKIIARFRFNRAGKVDLLEELESRLVGVLADQATA